MIWVGLLSLVALTVLSALSAALRTPSRARIAERFERLGQRDQLERFALLRPQYVLATALMRSIAHAALFLVVLCWDARTDTPLLSSHTVWACVVALAITMVFGVAVPNAWAKYAGHWMIVRLLPLLAIIRLICYPLLVVLQILDPLVRRLSGVPVRDAKSYADELEQELLDIISEGERHGAVDEEEKEMIESVIELGETRVEEIMTPRTDILALPMDADLKTVIEMVRAKGHSRIPVYDETIDKILGVMYAKDLLRYDQDTPFTLTDAMRDPLFIPETKLVRDMLREFQAKKLHIAIILDEYGGTAGLLTIEDIIEELVGEIADEYETTAPAELRRLDEQTVEVDARMRIDDLNDELNIELPEDEDYETIGGFVFSQLGRIPKVGERCEHRNIGIDVVAAEPRRITLLRVKVEPIRNDHDEDRR